MLLNSHHFNPSITKNTNQSTIEAYKTMKLILLALVFLFALSSEPLLGAANASPEEVVDTSGKILRAGANYYIVPVAPTTICGHYGRCRSGKGLALASIDEYCPLDVVVVDVKQYSRPLRFTPINPKKGVVRVSTDLNIMFSTTTHCPQSTVWKLDHFDAYRRQWFVATGGSIGNPGWETISNWFKIEKYDGAYKLVYCPSVCPSCKHMCKDVGVFLDDNERMRLALTDTPLKVKFQKA